MTHTPCITYHRVHAGGGNDQAYKNRTSWGLRCAQSHLDDFISKLAAGYFPHIANAELEIVK